MKTLQEVKENFKDVYIMHIADQEDERLKVRYIAQRDLMEFIYGEEFTKQEARWYKEALTEYFG